MADQSVTLKLQGNISVADFALAIEDFSKMLQGLSAHAKAKGMRWQVESLSAGSAEITAAVADPDSYAGGEVDLVRTAFLSIGRHIAGGSDLAAYPANVRKRALSLVELTSNGVDAILFETADGEALITSDQRTQAAPVTIPFPTATLGAVTGRVQSITNRGALRFALYETLTDRAVSCYLPPGKEDLMIDVWGKLSTVEGLVTRDPRSGRPLIIRHITNVVAYDECEAEDYKRARGAVVRLDRQPRAEDVIRKLRDAQ